MELSWVKMIWPALIGKNYFACFGAESYLFCRLYFVASSYWLGGEDRYLNDTFIWMDGVPVEAGYTNWGTGEPDHGSHDAIRTYSCEKWQWYDSPTSSSYYFLCEA